MNIKVGDKFYCNKSLVIDASDAIFTISHINFYNRWITIEWNEGTETSGYSYDLVEKYFNEGIWLNIRLERKKKLEKIGRL